MFVIFSVCSILIPALSFVLFLPLINLVYAPAFAPVGLLSSAFLSSSLLLPFIFSAPSTCYRLPSFAVAACISATAFYFFFLVFSLTVQAPHATVSSRWPFVHSHFLFVFGFFPCGRRPTPHVSGLYFSPSSVASVLFFLPSFRLSTLLS